MLTFALLLSFLMQAQAPVTGTAAVTGRVSDRSGGSLPGVTVTLNAQSASESRKVVTDSGGTYRFDRVPAGTYALRFELAGFTTYTSTRLNFDGTQTRTLNVALEVGRLMDPPLRIVGARPLSPDPTDPRFSLNDGEVALGIGTTVGTFYIAVDTKRAPVTANNFLRYVDAGLYTHGRFHRATRSDNYTPAPPDRPMMNIIQGGIDPTRRSEGFLPIPLERTSVTGIRHLTGVVSMARGTAADTATSDFFVLLDDQPSLDFGGRRFEDGQGGAAFGRVLSGLDIVRTIQQQPVDGQNLAGPVTIKRIWRLTR